MVDAFLMCELLFFTLGRIAALEKRQEVVVLHDCIVFITQTVVDGSLSILEHLYEGRVRLDASICEAVHELHEEVEGHELL